MRIFDISMPKQIKGDFYKSLEKDQLKLFLDESYETLNSLDKQLIQLGKNPDQREYLDTIHANFKTFLDSNPARLEKSTCRLNYTFVSKTEKALFKSEINLLY